MLTTTDCSKSTVVEFARNIRGEMKKLSSEAHDSILRDTLEAVKHFSWDTVMLEYAKMIPTLIMLLESLIPNPTARKPLVCFVASLLLKCRHQRMGLVQRAISIMLYGNGSSKQASFDLYIVWCPIIAQSFCFVTHAVIQQSSASQYMPVISRDTKLG